MDKIPALGVQNQIETLVKACINLAVQAASSPTNILRLGLKIAIQPDKFIQATVLAKG